MKTVQDAFDICVNHLLTQKVKSLSWSDRDEAETCRYRGYNGLMCGIGPLIDDNHYSFTLEGRAVDNPQVITCLRDSGWGDICDANLNVLRDVQGVHDYSSTEKWEEALKQLAVSHNLSWNYKE